MTDRKRKKNTRLRGSKTHGWGAMKKHRGAGHRGGRGNAGSGKRADQKKPSYWGKEKDPGKTGFTSFRRVDYVTINVGHLSSIADSLVHSGHAMNAQGAIVINLREMGYTKLLGAGSVHRKLRIAVDVCTPGAQKKIEAAGGAVDAGVIVDKDAVKAAREEHAKDMREKRHPKKAAAAAEPAAKKEVAKDEE